MSPDESLAEIRSLLSPPRSLNHVESLRLAELVDQLDDWLTHGGFLPTEWRRAES